MHHTLPHDPGEEALRPAKVKPGEVDLWDFDLGEYGGQVPCGNARTVIYYLLSPKTATAGVSEVQTVGIGGGSFRLKIRGPIADDGAALWVSYRLSAMEVAALSRVHKSLLQDGLKRVKQIDMPKIRRILRMPDAARKE